MDQAKRPDGPHTNGKAGNVIRAIIGTFDRLAVRLYSRVRFTIIREPFLEEIGQYLPRSGQVLDLGCGFGLLALYFAVQESRRQLTGIDLSSKRVESATASARKLGLSNVRFQACDVLEWRTPQRFDAIYMVDLLHHLPADQVPRFLAAARDLLSDEGVMVVKDVTPRPWYKMLFTLALDRLMVGMEPIHYWPPRELTAILHELGFDVVRHRMNDILPYPHVLYVCRLGRRDCNGRFE